MKQAQGALAGLKIIDLSRVLGGPYCSQALADHGAEVIKLEPLSGDETRGWGRRSKAMTPRTFAVSTATSRGLRSTCRAPQAWSC